MDMSELNRYLDDGPDEQARAIAISPRGSLHGNTQMGSAVGLRPYWREWRRLMPTGLSGKNSD